MRLTRLHEIKDKAITQSVKPDDPTQLNFTVSEGPQDDNDDWKLVWKALKANPEE